MPSPQEVHERELQTAIAFFGAEDRQLQWCNDGYRTLVRLLNAHDAEIGSGFEVLHPVFTASHPDAFDVVAGGGGRQHGEHRWFSVENGTLILRWSLHRNSSHVVVRIDSDWLDGSGSPPSG